MRILYSFLLCCLAHTAQAQCNATITPQGPTTFCQGGSVTLQASLGNVYKWFQNGNYFALLTTNTISINQSGSYKVVVDSMGCVDTSAALNITVNTIPAQPGPITCNDTMCGNSTQTFSVLAVPGATSYLWVVNNSGMVTSSVPTASSVVYGIMGPGPQKQISVRAQNSCGTSPYRYDTVNVFSAAYINNGVNMDPDPTYGASPGMCPGELMTLNAYSTSTNGYTGPLTYQWYRNNNLIPGATAYNYTLNKGGQYSVMIYSGNGICSTNYVKNPVIQVAPRPIITATNSGTSCIDGVSLMDLSWDSDGYVSGSYNWTLIKDGTYFPWGYNATHWVGLPGAYRILIYPVGWSFSCSSDTTMVTQAGNTAAPVFITQNGNVLTATSGFVSYQWYRMNQKITGATNSIYAIAQAGDYFVVSEDANGCFSKSNVVLGTEAFAEIEDQLRLYPNPTTGNFTLSADLGENNTAKLIITDIAGRTIHTKELRTNNGLIEEKIELDNSIAPGLYLLKLTTENYNKVVSFVKQ